jgi:glycosyltransferase involved in cell wall biosynthesis
VIEDGVDGLLVEHRDHVDLGKKLIDLLPDQERRYRLGDRGYKKTVDSFTWPKVVEKVERLFLELKPEKTSFNSGPDLVGRKARGGRSRQWNP